MSLVILSEAKDLCNLRQVAGILRRQRTAPQDDRPFFGALWRMRYEFRRVSHIATMRAFKSAVSFS
jgi:hypothetical protein